MISFLCDFFAYDSIYSIEKACQNSAENSCYAPGKSIAFQYSADQHTANEGERYTDQFVSGYWFMKEDSSQAYLVSFWFISTPILCKYNKLSISQKRTFLWEHVRFVHFYESL